jgi:hypothetical protein
MKCLLKLQTLTVLSSALLVLYYIIYCVRYWYMLLFTGASHLSSPLAKVPKGLIHLNLSHCGLSSKGVNQLAHALSLNKFMPSTLTYLNLSDNNLKEEINVSFFANISIIFYNIQCCMSEIRYIDFLVSYSTELLESYRHHLQMQSVYCFCTYVAKVCCWS